MKPLDLFLKVSLNVLLLILIATTEYEREYVQLFLIGAALNALPALLGKAIKNQATAESLFIAATYGGGNRGVLLVSLFFPHKLLEFLVIDLGNYLSLLLVYPLASKKRYFDRQSMYMLAMAVSAVAGGIYMNWNNILFPCHSEIKSAILYVIIAYSLYQIVLWFGKNKQKLQLHTDFALFLGVRLCVIISVLAIYYVLSGTWLTTLLIFIVLPVSSLLFAVYTPEDRIYGRVVNDTVMSMVMYCVALILLLFTKLFA